MKRCSDCNALYAPRHDECPFCDTVPSSAPQAWIRTKSKTKTRRTRAIAPEAKGQEPLQFRETTKPRKIHPKSLFLQSEYDEIDPVTLDHTVEISLDFMNDHSSEMIAAVDGTGEAFKPDALLDAVWKDFEDHVPTAEVLYLGEDDPDSYDFEDLVAPPAQEAISNILTHGVEELETSVPPDDFFVDISALEELSDWSQAVFEPPTTDAIYEARAREVSVSKRMNFVNEIVEKSRRLAADTPVPPPGVQQESAPRERVPTATLSEGSATAMPTRPERSVDERLTISLRPDSTWVARLAGVGLAVVAGWALAMSVAWPVIAALAVGSIALLLLGGRNG